MTNDVAKYKRHDYDEHIEHVHNMVFRTITAVSPLAITMTGVPSGGTPSVQTLITESTLSSSFPKH